MYISSNESIQYYKEAYDSNGYGGMAYISSKTCGYINNSRINTGCTTDYEKSDVKYVIDNWGDNKIGKANYNDVRLLKEDEYIQLCDIVSNPTPSDSYNTYIPQYDWQYSIDYRYLLMNSERIVDIRGGFDSIASNTIYNYSNVVRPVVELYKCALDDSCVKDDGSIDENDKKSEDSVIKQIFNVPNTLKKVSIIFVMLGVILISLGLIILVKNKDKIRAK